MEITSPVTIVLCDILIVCFCLFILAWIAVGIETFISDRKREKRGLESARREEEYHRKRMEELNR